MSRLPPAPARGYRFRVCGPGATSWAFTFSLGFMPRTSIEMLLPTFALVGVVVTVAPPLARATDETARATATAAAAGNVILYRMRVLLDLGRTYQWSLFIATALFLVDGCGSDKLEK